MLGTIWHPPSVLQFKRVQIWLFRGVSLKFHEPPESRRPTDIWRIYIFKG